MSTSLQALWQEFLVPLAGLLWMLLAWVLPILLLLLFALAYWLTRGSAFAERLHAVRVPLVAGGMLALLPWYILPGNLFDLSLLSAAGLGFLAGASAGVILRGAYISIGANAPRSRRRASWAAFGMLIPAAITLAWNAADKIAGLAGFCLFAWLAVGLELRMNQLSGVAMCWRWWKVTGINVKQRAAVWLIAGLPVWVLLAVFAVGLWPQMLGTEWVVVYVYGLILAFTWMLLVTAAVLDRHLVPLSVTAVWLTIFLIALGGREHVYKVTVRSRQADGCGVPTAAKALAERARKQSIVTVVATSGGGIRAALWTTIVLRTLAAGTGEKFLPSIAAISAVSGGSIGTVHFLDRMTESSGDRSESLAKAEEVAGQSSLGALPWGFLLDCLPIQRFWWDRGWALERVWRSAMVHPDRMLSDWGGLAATGDAPAVFYNATGSATGRMYYLSSVSLLETNRPGRAHPFVENDRCPDMPAVTAARLSATFPLVTPLARAWNEKVAFDYVTNEYLADGGYVDNWGVTTAIEYISSVRRELAGKRVLLVEIRSSDQEESLKERTRPINQLLGPLGVLLATQEKGQIPRNNANVEALDKELKADGIELTRVVFVFEGTVPTTWHLSRRQQEQVRDAMKSERNRKALQQVASLLQ
ncbi:MAG: patatin-like phospholipase family protein [Acidobacteria bacterium]|nr:patatin-like phospholipase family protein [Acidobacteriota bacterium]MBI3657678.1 patatin-like phospholipase family protein [Acidobacteriota bacterium]